METNKTPNADTAEYTDTRSFEQRRAEVLSTLELLLDGTTGAFTYPLNRRFVFELVGVLRDAKTTP